MGREKGAPLKASSIRFLPSMQVRSRGRVYARTEIKQLHGEKRGSRWKSSLPDCHQPCVPDSKLFMRLGFHDNTEGLLQNSITLVQ